MSQSKQGVEMTSRSASRSHHNTTRNVFLFSLLAFALALVTLAVLPWLPHRLLGGSVVLPKSVGLLIVRAVIVANWSGGLWLLYGTHGRARCSHLIPSCRCLFCGRSWEFRSLVGALNVFTEQYVCTRTPLIAIGSVGSGNP